MCSRTKMPETPAPNNQEVEALHTLLYVEDNPANLMRVKQIIEGHPTCAC